MNEVRLRLHDKGLNEGCFLGSDVKESKLDCEEKKNGNNLKNWLKRAYLKIAN